MLFGLGRAYRRFVKLRRREGGDELCNHFVLSGVGCVLIQMWRNSLIFTVHKVFDNIVCIFSLALRVLIGNLQWK